MVSSLWLKLRNLKIILWVDVTTSVVLGRQVFGQVGTLQNRHLLPADGIANTNQTKVGGTGILVSVGPNWAQGTVVNWPKSIPGQTQEFLANCLKRCKIKTHLFLNLKSRLDYCVFR